jgi:hypothetical protein
MAIDTSTEGGFPQSEHEDDEVTTGTTAGTTLGTTTEAGTTTGTTTGDGHLPRVGE